MLLADKVAIVTGASSGIGKAIAWELLCRGAYCVLASRNEAKLNQIRESWLLENKGFEKRIFVVGLDVTKKDHCQKAVEKVSQEFGRLEILVNNAGYGVYGLAAETPMNEAKALFETNFFGAAQMTMTAFPLLKKSKESCVVMVSSIAGKIGVPWMSYYCSSKFALNAFSEAIRAELMPYGIRVLVVMPGPVKTAFTENARSMFGEKLANAASGGHLPEDIAQATAQALEKNKREVVVGWGNRALICARNSLSLVADRLMARLLGPWEKGSHLDI